MTLSDDQRLVSDSADAQQQAPSNEPDGHTFAQSESSARHAGMPHSAIESGSVDFVLTPKEIAQRLVEIASHPYLDPLQPPESVAASDEHYKQILGAVRVTTKRSVHS